MHSHHHHHGSGGHRDGRCCRCRTGTGIVTRINQRVSSLVN
ncbi:MAG: hypothetical protein PHE99_04545 [Bacteroidales bacterium]|nr:hypothetical protein [Bacteroidales bacterium]